MRPLAILAVAACLLALCACTQGRSLGPAADTAAEAWRAKVAADPAHRASCTVDGVSATLPAGWFEVPLDTDAPGAARHLFVHDEHTRANGILPMVRVFLHPGDEALLHALFTDADTLDAFAAANLPLYENATLEVDPEARVARHVYKCLDAQMGVPVFRCTTLVASDTGVVEVQYQDELSNLTDPASYYEDVELLMQSVTRR